jgi:hypothetical protein
MSDGVVLVAFAGSTYVEIRGARDMPAMLSDQE